MTRYSQKQKYPEFSNNERKITNKSSNSKSISPVNNGKDK